MAEKEYIEREAAIRAIIGQPNEPHYPGWYYMDIKGIPAADVVPVVHGEWILHDNGDGTCNQCHFRQKLIWDYDNWQNYCGVCGARMDGGTTVSLIFFTVAFIAYAYDGAPLTDELFHIWALFSIADALWIRNFFK